MCFQLNYKKSIQNRFHYLSFGIGFDLCLHGRNFHKPWNFTFHYFGESKGFWIKFNKITWNINHKSFFSIKHMSIYEIYINIYSVFSLYINLIYSSLILYWWTIISKYWVFLYYFSAVFIDIHIANYKKIHIFMNVYFSVRSVYR